MIRKKIIPDPGPLGVKRAGSVSATLVGAGAAGARTASKFVREAEVRCRVKLWAPQLFKNYSILFFENTRFNFFLRSNSGSGSRPRSGETKNSEFEISIYSGSGFDIKFRILLDPLPQHCFYPPSLFPPSAGRCCIISEEYYFLVSICLLAPSSQLAVPLYSKHKQFSTIK
jgi:hypothetical protein